MHVVAAMIVVAALLASAGLVRGAKPGPTGMVPGATSTPTLNPGQEKKATPSPAPTPAPTAVVMPAPTAAPTPAPGGTVGGATAPGASAGSGAAPTVAPPSAATETTGPEPSSTPSSGLVVAGSVAAGGAAPDNGAQVLTLFALAVLGVGAIAGAWFIAGRRSRHDEDGPAQGHDPGAPAVAMTGSEGSSLRIPTGPASRLSVSMGPAGTSGRRDAAVANDPLLAALHRARDPRNPGRGMSASGIKIMPPTTGIGVDDEAFRGPSWVRRLDPEIRVKPELALDAERAVRPRGSGSGSGADRPAALEAESQRSA